MKFYVKILTLLMLLLALMMVDLSNTANAEETTEDLDVNPMCDDAKVLSNVFTQVCWDCFIDSINLMGMSSGNAPAGAASVGPFCMCSDNLGVPYAGIPKAHWQPTRLNEVVTTPWCSPSLGGIKLQDTLTGLVLVKTH